MKKEIKFRAYNTADKEMYPWHQLIDDHYELDELETSGQFAHIFMQFTGLKDKKGVEIYEGDIIIAGNGKKETIEFGEWQFELSYEHVTDKINGIGFSFSGIEPFGKCAFGGGSQYEVIGNIYENPELLK